MIYTILTKIWKYSSSHGVKWLADPLTRLLNYYWRKTYCILEYTFVNDSKGRFLEFTFELNYLGKWNLQQGMWSPQILGSIWYTIITHPKVANFKGHKIVILDLYYIDGEQWILNPYNLTRTSTPEDFTKHFTNLIYDNPNTETILLELNAKVVLSS